MDEQAAINRFLRSFLEDRRRSAIRDLAHYQESAPDHAGAIAREFTRLVEPGDTESELERDELESLAGYELVRRLGGGGQGTVWLARDSRLGRHVALKVLSGLAAVTPQALSRFLREARLVSKLEHPGICTVYESGIVDDVPFLALQFVEGESLAQRIRHSRSLPSKRPTKSPSAEGDPASSDASSGTWTGVDDVLRYVEEVARILHVAHEAGIVHRDVKPGNLMVSPDGRPVVLDFGLARELEGQDPTLTRAGDILGTPLYMSPEQVRGAGPAQDRRTDVYSLGVCLYECLTLEQPFKAPTSQAVFHRILSQAPRDPRSINPAVSKDLKVVLEVAMEKSPARRYQTALDLAEDLRRIRQHEPILARPAGPLLRLVRWAQRSPALAASLTTVLAVLVGGLAITGYFLREQSVLAANLAEREQEARRNADDERALRELFQAIIFNADPSVGGKDAALVDFFRAGLDEVERFAGAEDKKADLQQRLGELFFEWGEFEASEQQIESALEIRWRLFGDDDPATLDSLAARARLCRTAGKPEEAARLHRQVLAGREATLGEDHVLTLRTMNELAMALTVQGELEEARELASRALDASEQLDGPDSPEALSALLTLGSCYHFEGNWEEAIRYWGMAGERGSAEQHHRRNLVTSTNYSIALDKLGRFDEAEVVREELAAWAVPRFGPGHPNVIELRMSRASALTARGRGAEALALYEQLVPDADLAFGPAHENAVTLRRILVQLLMSEQRWAEAAACLEDGLEGARAAGAAEPTTGLWEALLARCRQKLGQ